MTALLDRLESDPIPPDAIDALCASLKPRNAHFNSRGRDHLARLVEVTPTTVRRWVGGQSQCAGAFAERVRKVARTELGS